MEAPDSQSTNSLPWSLIEFATELYARAYGLSGPQIHRAFARYTDRLGRYPMDDKPSRWQIFQRGMEALTRDDQTALLWDLIAAGVSTDEVGVAELRSRLADGTGLTSGQVGRHVQALGWEQVDRDWRQALEQVATHPEGAITAARSTLESVCKHICDERGATYPVDGDLTRLYKAAATTLNLAPEQHTEQIFKQILTGVSTTVSGIAALRNALSDAHGRSKGAVRPAPRHARIAVNLAFSLAGFLIDSHLEKPT